MQKNVYEIFNEFRDAASKEAKIRVLRDNDSIILRYILKAAFHPEITFIGVDNIVYKPLHVPPGLGDTNLFYEYKRMYLFERGNPYRAQTLTEEKTQRILIGLLEALEAREAEVLLSSMRKNINVEGLTHALVYETFPGLVPEPVAELVAVVEEKQKRNISGLMEANRRRKEEAARKLEAK